MFKNWIVRWVAMACVMSAGAAMAQTYPNKPIRMVVPYAPGGGLDAITRLVAQQMSEGLGQSIVVENKAGAGGMIGAEAVAKAVPDGYTVLMAGNPELVITPTLTASQRYSVTKDFIPIMLVAESPNIVVAHPGVKASLRDMLQGVDRGDGPISIGTPGQGSPQHLTVEVLKSLGRANWTHVPYKGAGPAIIDVLGGQTQLSLTGAPPLLPHIRSGKLKALAVTQPRRSSLIPDVPTVEEASGVKGLDSYSTWYGLLVPAGTPQAVIDTLQKSIAAVLARPDVNQRINEMGSEVIALQGAAFADRIRAENRRYEEVIRRFNIKPE